MDAHPNYCCTEPTIEDVAEEDEVDEWTTVGCKGKARESENEVSH